MPRTVAERARGKYVVWRWNPCGVILDLGACLLQLGWAQSLRTIMVLDTLSAWSHEKKKKNIRDMRQTVAKKNRYTVATTEPRTQR